MLALNIAAALRSQPDRRPETVQACAERAWRITDSTLQGYADEILAVAGDTVAGVFTVRGWSRDADDDNLVVFDLEPAPEWQWLVDQPSPITWHRGKTDPVRKVGTVITDELRGRRAHRLDAGLGWFLDVDLDGRGATVRAPSGSVAVVEVGSGTVRLRLLEAR